MKLAQFVGNCWKSFSDGGQKHEGLDGEMLDKIYRKRIDMFLLVMQFMLLM